MLLCLKVPSGRAYLKKFQKKPARLPVKGRVAKEGYLNGS